MKFADIKNNVAFRKIFGNQHKSIVLISFLNAVLDLEGANRIIKVTIIDPFLLPRIAGEKASIIDVRATDQKGRKFIVEMQVAEKSGFEKRVQYYASRDYSMQIDRGQDYPKLRATYFVGILNFGIGFGKDYLAKHYNIEEETGKNVLDDIQYRFIQLTKFKKKRNELITLVDKWTFFIKNAPNLKFIPDDIEDKGLKVAYEEADRYTWTKDELIAYDNASMREQDYIGEVEFALKKGLAEKEREVVIGLFENNVPIPIIANSLQISVEKVTQIIAQYQSK